MSGLEDRISSENSKLVDEADNLMESTQHLRDWRMYIDSSELCEEILGSTFKATSEQEIRLKKLNDSNLIPREMNRKLLYEERSVVLKQFLNERHLKDVYKLASHMKGFIKDDELIPTLLALYELKLFVETKQLINDYTYKEIFDEHYYTGRASKFVKNKNSIKASSIIFFHKMSKMIHDLYTQRGEIFNFNSRIIKSFSKAIRSYIDAYLYDDLQIDQKYKTICSSEHYEELKNIRAPRLFTKVLLNKHVRQQLQDVYIKLNRKEYTSTINPERLMELADNFDKYYLSDNNKWIKTSFAIGLTILRELDPELVKEYTRKEGIKRFSTTYHNLKNRHGAFLYKIVNNGEEPVDEVIEEEEVLLDVQEQETLREEEIFVSPIEEILAENELLEQLTNDPEILIDSGKIFTHYSKYLGITQQEMLKNAPYMTWLALNQLETFFREGTIRQPDHVLDILVGMEKRFEYKIKRKKKDLWSLYTHRMAKIFNVIYCSNTSVIDPKNDFIISLHRNISRLLDGATDRKCTVYLNYKVAQAMMKFLFPT
ncbi:MAG: hypothetical protein HeimC3_13740 [Candidatus Heimdallarchaeota archaeon LC_3]|nr:MAG: hypothetical protein HeimC3_13740 [Candidatus Heimdallarchaeota archaeon LC_3]